MYVRHTPAEIEERRNLVAGYIGQGLSIRQVAKLIGCSARTVRRDLGTLDYIPNREFDDSVPCPHECGRYAHPLPAEATSILGWPACVGGTLRETAA